MVVGGVGGSLLWTESPTPLSMHSCTQAQDLMSPHGGLEICVIIWSKTMYALIAQFSKADQIAFYNMNI